MDIKNFAVIKGNVITQHGLITYKAGNSGDAWATVRSNISFNNGTIEFAANIKSHNTGINLAMNSFGNQKVRIGCSRTTSKFSIRIEDEVWRSLSKAGSLNNYEFNKDIFFKIHIEGSLIKLFINDIFFCEANLSTKESPIEFSLISDADFTLHNIKLTTSTPKLFVVMQFSSEYNELYNEVIKPVSEKLRFDCIRGDEFYAGTPILLDITKSIKEATAIIAEITPDNPNVFYEIGYSHAIEKPTILLCDKRRANLPFDLSSFRTLYYENTIAGKKKIEINLTKYLENIKSSSNS
ncbi:hypothetical protein [Mucilaginibacter celer]|uniref:Uncharacterized protein n=1 Tax=Mucilaginibacter celer TaxID=2305508 RepID=A0A494VTH9_9SPHI|nr:hypothetical protein [Mucilaginibacter celer]AYL97371.1 hypothetical protein HYN43_019575 [Mucilaginibacter celer]